MANTYTQMYIQFVFAVVKYIINQEQHHKKKTFREEYIEFLNRFNIDYDERYILKDIQ